MYSIFFHTYIDIYVPCAHKHAIISRHTALRETRVDIETHAPSYNAARAMRLSARHARSFRIEHFTRSIYLSVIIPNERGGRRRKKKSALSTKIKTRTPRTYSNHTETTSSGDTGVCERNNNVADSRTPGVESVGVGAKEFVRSCVLCVVRFAERPQRRDDAVATHTRTRREIRR